MRGDFFCINASFFCIKAYFFYQSPFQQSKPQKTTSGSEVVQYHAFS